MVFPVGLPIFSFELQRLTESCSHPGELDEQVVIRHKIGVLQARFRKVYCFLLPRRAFDDTPKVSRTGRVIEQPYRPPERAAVWSFKEFVGKFVASA
jgi:hypothetical protein